MRSAARVLALLVCASPGITLAQEFIPAHPDNYSNGRGGATVERIVLHTTEGGMQSAINTFRAPGQQVSAHYVISREGVVVQMVRDRDRAYHVVGHNRTTIGIEHEGRAHDPNQWTQAQLQASASLVRRLCDQYGVAKDRTGIVSHAELDPSRRSDPGPYFPWEEYLRLVNGDSGPLASLPRETRRQRRPAPGRAAPVQASAPARSGYASAPQASSPRRPSPSAAPASAAPASATPRVSPSSRGRQQPRRAPGTTPSPTPSAPAPASSSQPAGPASGSAQPETVAPPVIAPAADGGVPPIPRLTLDQRYRVSELMEARSKLGNVDTPDMREILGELTRLAAVPFRNDAGWPLYAAAISQGSDVSNGRSFTYDGATYHWTVQDAWPVPVGGVKTEQSRTTGGDQALSAEEQELLERLVLAEAGGEGELGMALVTRAVLNRLALIQSGEIQPGTYLAQGDTLRDVVYAQNQFQPVSDGSLNASRSSADRARAQRAIQLARDTDALGAQLRAQGRSPAQVDRLLSATGFRTPSAYNDSSQNYARERFGGHVFNGDRFSTRADVPSAFEQRYGAQ